VATFRIGDFSATNRFNGIVPAQVRSIHRRYRDDSIIATLTATPARPCRLHRLAMDSADK
jgi:hypothetical protein